MFVHWKRTVQIPWLLEGKQGGELREKKVLEIIFDSSCPKRVAAWLWGSKNHPRNPCKGFPHSEWNSALLNHSGHFYSMRVWRCRSANVRVWRCRSADARVWGCITTAAFLRRTLRRRSREKITIFDFANTKKIKHTFGKQKQHVFNLL